MTERSWHPQSPADGREQDSTHRPATPALSRFAHQSPQPTPPQLPMPGPAPEEKKKPFWRRIALTRPASENPTTTSLEPILARLAALEREFQAYQRESEDRLARSERIVRRLEEHSRQVSLLEIRRRFEGLEIDQAEAEESLDAARRSLTGLAGLAILALLSAAGALFAFFYFFAAR